MELQKLKVHGEKLSILYPVPDIRLKSAAQAARLKATTPGTGPLHERIGGESFYDSLMQSQGILLLAF
jgi:hypothetical protein